MFAWTFNYFDDEIISMHVLLKIVTHRNPTRLGVEPRPSSYCCLVEWTMEVPLMPPRQADQCLLFDYFLCGHELAILKTVGI